MKKITCILMASMFTLLSVGTMAQKEEEKMDTVKIDLGETTVFIITDADLKDSTFIDTIRDLDKSNKSAQDYAWAGIDGFQIGAIGLFTKSGDRAFADRPDLAPNTARCSMLGFTPFGKEAEIFKDRLRLAAGLGFQFESYAFDKNVRLTDEPSLQGIEDTIRDYRKNTLNANYVTLPVVLQFNTKRNLEKSFHIAVGVLAGYRISSNMTYKWSEEGRRQRERLRNDYALEPYRLSAIAQVGIGNAMIWAQYDMTMKFTATDAIPAVVGAKGTPEVYAWSAGINIPFGEY
jgi:hypothetical protein